MSTAQSIIDGAIHRSLANDEGQTDVASDQGALTVVLSRLVRSVYTLAALPPGLGGLGEANYFTRTTTVTVGTPNTTFVAMPTAPEFAFIPTFTTAGGVVVSVVTLVDLREGVAEYPPAIVIADNQFRSAARPGDPAANDTLTLDGAYLPAAMTAVSHVVGATTPTDASTSQWPEHAGDQFLVDAMAIYLATRSGDRDQLELGEYKEGLANAAEILGAVVGVAPAKLTKMIAA